MGRSSTEETLRVWFPGADLRDVAREAYVDLGPIEVSPLFNSDDDAYAILTYHRAPDGESHPLLVRLVPDPNAPNSRVWHIDEEEPLTLSPSIQCPKCSLHGYIREGRWVSV